jgi:cytochrome P450
MTAHAMAPVARPYNVPAELVVDWDIHNPPGGRDDVHRAWDALHNGPDIVWSPQNGGHWIVTRFDDADFLQRNHDPFSMQNVTLPSHTTARILPLEADPPEHGEYRAIVSPWFTPKNIDSLGEFTRGLAIELIEGFKAKGECEFINDFALVLPIAIFCKLTNVPWNDRKELLEWTEWSTRGTVEQRDKAQQMMGAYAEKIIADRRANPGTDIMTDVVNAKIGGQPIQQQDIISMMMTILFGGLDTVASTMGFIAHFLATHPAHRKQLVDNPALINQAIEELLRRFPVSATARTVTREYDYKGLHFKKGDKVFVVPTLANLDDRKYENPFEVDFNRKNTIHAGFGAGPHRCPGSFLARTEIKVYLEEWLKRIPDFTVKPGEKVVFATGMVNAVHYLPLSWKV